MANRYLVTPGNPFTFAVTQAKKKLEIRFRAVRIISVLLLALGVSSAFTGMFANLFIFSVVTNLLFCIFVITSRAIKMYPLWSKEIIWTQSIFGIFHVFLLVILDCLILSHSLFIYKYCYGSLNSSCQVYQGLENYSLVCESIGMSGAIEEVHLKCIDRPQLLLIFTSIGINCAGVIIMVPYILLSLTLIALQKSAQLDFPTASEPSNPSISVVILGSKVAPGDEEVMYQAYPKDLKLSSGSLDHTV